MTLRMGLFSLVSFYFVTLTLFANDLDSNAPNASLRAEILEMCEREQELRGRWVDAFRAKSGDEAQLRELVIQIDERHLIRLKEIIGGHGWPGFLLIGPEGAHAFWLLVQHIPELEFQKHCLVLLEQAVARQDADIIDLAYLQDRVLMLAGKKQIYGTQFMENDHVLTIYPIEDEEHVNERRVSIGLCTLEDYFALIQTQY